MCATKSIKPMEMKYSLNTEYSQEAMSVCISQHTSDPHTLISVAKTETQSGWDLS